MLRWRPGQQPRITPWFTPSLEEDRSIALRDAPHLLRETVRDAVAASLPAEAGVATALLSGGLDSSLIVGLLAEQGQHGLATFSIGFDTIGDELP